MEIRKKLLSSIPAVDEVLKSRSIESLLEEYPRTVVTDSIREYLNEHRTEVLRGGFDNDNIKEPDIEYFVTGIIKKVEATMKHRLVSVINATGVILHTNLGRAVLSEEVNEMLIKIASRYSNLELELSTGERGSRYSHVEEHICRLTGAEAAMVVNNNAAAVLLVLSTMARDKEVVVSRGQLVEIGGSFRIPEVMEQSGAVLREVGATNKTHLRDYEGAVNEKTAALMKVHTSNYKICGFTKEVSSEELVELAAKLELPTIEDLGSGVLIDLTRYGLPYEPTVQSSIKAGIDIVTFSGDKMLGGPQAGIIAGKKHYIDKMRKNPLTRAFRIDKLTLAALEGTLRLYYDEEKAVESIPLLRMLTLTLEQLEHRAEELKRKLEAIIGKSCSVYVTDEFSEVGGGSMPMHKLPTKAVAIKTHSISADRLDSRLRAYKIPVITRISRDAMLLDIRTIMDDEYDTITEAFEWALMENQQEK